MDGNGGKRVKGPMIEMAFPTLHDGGHGLFAPMALALNLFTRRGITHGFLSWRGECVQ